MNIRIVRWVHNVMGTGFEFRRPRRGDTTPTKNRGFARRLATAGEINLGAGSAYLLGDATLDGVVDGLDFVEWNNNKYKRQSPGFLPSPTGWV